MEQYELEVDTSLADQFNSLLNIFCEYLLPRIEGHFEHQWMNEFLDRSRYYGSVEQPEPILPYRTALKLIKSFRNKYGTTNKIMTKKNITDFFEVYIVEMKNMRELMEEYVDRVEDIRKMRKNEYLARRDYAIRWCKPLAKIEWPKTMYYTTLAKDSKYRARVKSYFKHHNRCVNKLRYLRDDISKYIETAEKLSELANAPKTGRLTKSAYKRNE